MKGLKTMAEITAREVLKMSLDLLYEDTTEYNAYVVTHFNTLIPELYETEQSIRTAKGEELLTEVPFIASLDDVIPYDERILRGAMPFGLASYIVLDDNDMSRVAYFRQLYVNAVNSFSSTAPEMVVDHYA